jgi:hypothetical protein
MTDAVTGLWTVVGKKKCGRAGILDVVKRSRGSGRKGIAKENKRLKRSQARLKRRNFSFSRSR